MKTNFIFLFILFIGLNYPCQAQQVDTGNFKAGKCYAKCKIPEEVVVEVEEFAVYTGDGTEDVEVVEMEIIVKPAEMGWEKKIADRNCLSSDPKDCLVWCLVEKDAVVRTIQVLVDTTQSKNYIIERIEKRTSEKKGGAMEWREVVCEKDIDASLIQSIQNRLQEKGFYEGEINGRLDRFFKKALASFQKENTLPLGQLDYETLDVLGVVVD